jgi:hypothetical protein
MTGPTAAEVAALLAESDRRDRELAARLAMWREGYAAGSDGRFGQGYAACAADVKAVHHSFYDGAVVRADVDRRRWTVRRERRTRATFGDPHPGDFPGREQAGRPAA